MSTPAPTEAAPDIEGDGHLVAPEIPFLAREITVVPIDAIAPHPANPNIGDVGQIGLSIDEVGFYSTIYVQESSGLILAGEHRWRSLREKGAVDAPVVYLDVDDETALRILIADNEIPRRHSYADDARLAALLTDLATQTPRGLTGTGFDGDALDRLLADLNTPLDPESKNGSSNLAILDVTLGDPHHATARGDVWRLGKHTLFVCDVVTGWPQWAPALVDGTGFMPYAGLFVALADAAIETPLVLVQPDTWIAGHIIDKFASVRGEDEVSKQ